MAGYMNPVTGNDSWAKAAGAAMNFFANGFSGPTRDEQRLLDAKIALQKAQADKLRTEQAGLEMQNAAPANAEGLFGRMMLEMADPSEQARPTPNLVGPMPAETPGMIRDRYAPEFFRNAMEYSSGKPGDLGGVFRAAMGAMPGGAYDQNVMDRAMMGAGDPYKDTAAGFGESEANDLMQAFGVADINNASAMDRLKATPLTEPQARAKEFEQLDPSMRRAAVGPTETEMLGALLGANFDNMADLDPNRQQVLGGYVAPINVGDSDQIYAPNMQRGDAPLAENKKDFDPRGGEGTLQAVTYIHADGTEEPGLFDNKGGYFNQSGQPYPLPEGTKVVRIGQPQGSNDDLGLTNKTRAGLEQNKIAASEFNTVLGATRESAKKAGPEAFGTVGNVLRLAQGFVGQVDAVRGALGMGVDSQTLGSGIASMQAMAASEGRSIDPHVVDALKGLYDPNMDSMDRLATLLAFKAASALGGQEGRGLSDKDFVIFRDMIGDPTAWLMSQQKFLNGLDLLESTVIAMARNRGIDMGLGGAQQDQQTGVIKWGVDAEGNPVQMESQ